MKRLSALLLAGVTAALILAALFNTRTPAPRATSPPSATTPAASPTIPADLPSGSVAVTVTDGEKPVGDVALTLAGGARRGDLDGRTGADGRFAFPRVSTGSWKLTTTHPRFAHATETVVVEEGREATVTITLIAGGRLSGIIREAATGQPVAGADVSLLDVATKRPLQMALRTRTSGTGEYALDRIPLGPFGILVLARNYRPFDRYDLVVATNGETIPFDILLKAGTTISGRVLDGTGTPVVGATVSGSNEHSGIARTDADGRFTVSGLGDGSVHLFAAAPGFGTTFARNVTPGTQGLEIRMLKAATLAGRVVAIPPPRTFTLLFYRFDADFGKELLVKSQEVNGADGSFRVENLSDGPYSIAVEAKGYTVPSRVEATARAGEVVGGIEIPAVANPE